MEEKYFIGSNMKVLGVSILLIMDTVIDASSVLLLARSELFEIA